MHVAADLFEILHGGFLWERYRTVMTMTTNAKAILAVIRAIPAGETRGYGEVARLAGFPRGARLVARVLGENTDPKLPWHRVLRSDGRIAMPPDSVGFAEQAKRLRAEGVVVENGRVRTPRKSAAVTLDEILWAPPAATRRKR
jgi:methylated-DNA-protein-cysteine methyltransferase-like protein